MEGEPAVHALNLHHPPADLLPCRNYPKGKGVLLSWDQGPNLVGQSCPKGAPKGPRLVWRSTLAAQSKPIGKDAR